MIFRRRSTAAASLTTRRWWWRWGTRRSTRVEREERRASRRPIWWDLWKLLFENIFKLAFSKVLYFFSISCPLEYVLIKICAFTFNIYFFLKNHSHSNKIQKTHFRIWGANLPSVAKRVEPVWTWPSPTSPSCPPASRREPSWPSCISIQIDSRLYQMKLDVWPSTKHINKFMDQLHILFVVRC